MKDVFHRLHLRKTYEIHKFSSFLAHEIFMKFHEDLDIFFHVMPFHFQHLCSEDISINSPIQDQMRTVLIFDLAIRETFPEDKMKNMKFYSCFEIISCLSSKCNCSYFKFWKKILLEAINFLKKMKFKYQLGPIRKIEYYKL